MSMKRLKELENELERLGDIAYVKYPMVFFDDPLFKENHDEWIRLKNEHEKASKEFMRFWKKNRREIENLTIEENKKNGVYWDREDWVYDMVKSIPQHFELTGQERTKKFVEDLEKVHGCVVEDDGAGYTLEVFTPYKVYLYRFNRGYGDYPIVIHKGFIAPSGNTYRNKIFLAKSTKDMKANYHKHEL